MTSQLSRHASSPSQGQGFLQVPHTSPAGPQAASAFGQHDLLGIPHDSASMPFDPSVPRSFRPNSGLADNLDIDFDIGRDKSSTAYQSTERSRSPWQQSQYVLQSGRSLPNDAQAPPLERFESEEPAWNPVGVVGAPPKSSAQGQAHPLRRFPSQSGSDSFSRHNHTDEGYHTLSSASQHDSRSVMSMQNSGHNYGQQNMFTPSVSRPPNPNQPSPMEDMPDQNYLRFQHDQYAPQISMPPPQQVPQPLLCKANGCNHSCKTQSEMNKHDAWHKKEHICHVQDCPRKGRGFTTVNDLERHQKTVHRIQPERQRGKNREYKCFAPGCPKHDKEWPRLDNFKQHLIRMHTGEDADKIDALIRRQVLPNRLPSLSLLTLESSNQWYDSTRRGPETTTPTQVRNASSTIMLTPGVPARANSRSSAVRSVPNLSQNDAQQSATNAQDDGQARRRNNATVSLSHDNVNSWPSAHNGAKNMHRSHSFQFPGVGANYRCSVPGCHTILPTAQSLRDHLRAHGRNPHSSNSDISSPAQAYLVPPSQSQSVIDAPSFANYNATTERSLNSSLLHQDNSRTDVPCGTFLSVARTAPNPSIGRLEELEATNPGFSTQQYHMQQFEDFDPSNTASNFPSEQALISLGEVVNAEFHSPSRVVNTQPFPNAPDQTFELSVSIRNFLKNHASTASNTGLTLTPMELEHFIQKEVQSRQVSSTALTSSAATPNVAVDCDFDDNSIATSVGPNGKKVYHCSDATCQKTRMRMCDLRKHIQRHKLPYGCTFPKCKKKFGSKYDWKRHEIKQHHQQECWRCDGLSNPCLKLFYKEDDYRTHLRQYHNASDPSDVTPLVRQQRIGQRSQVRYWCGFCNAIVPMVKKGIDGDDERFNHIDDHFMKQRCKIEHWHLPAGGFKKGNEPDELSSDDENHHHPEPASAMLTPPRSTRKRSAQSAFSSESSQPRTTPRSAASQSSRQFVFCCECGDGPRSSHASPACIICGHKICKDCNRQSHRE